MDNIYIPGTTLPYSDTNATAFAHIRPLIAATRGLGLAQVCAITGLEGSTIQNWVKRGWIGKLRDKKYNESQVARILIINALRGCLQLDNIARLMTYVNGVVEDPTDDIVDEGELFSCLCEAARSPELIESISEERVGRTVDWALREYKGSETARERLRAALIVMVYACLTSELANATNLMLGRLF
jgi:DNA-binding transcriptional MerR regulator